MAIRSILVPTDFSDLATAALRTAGTVARATGASITALYANAFLPPPHFTSAQVGALAESIEASRTSAARALEDHARGLVGDLPHRTLVAERPAADAILEEAARRAYELVVMGTHGRSGIDRALLGSVTERVLRRLAVPLLTVRGDQSVVGATLLVPTDFGEASRAALDFAIATAPAFGCSIRLLHVSEAGAAPRWDLHDQQLAGTRIAVEREEREGLAEDVILRAAQERPAVIVLGVEHKRFRDTTVLGTRAVRVLRHAEAPVIAVPRLSPAPAR